MIPLDDPTAGRSAPVLAKRKVETRAADAAIGVGLAQRRRNLPAGRRRARHVSDFVADQKAQTGVLCADTFARRKREAACRGEIGRRTLAGHFGDDASERAAAQRFFQRPEHIDWLRHAEHQQARRGHAEQIEAGAIRSAALVRRVIGGHPKNLPSLSARARRNSEGKPAGGAEIDGRRGGKLMQRAAGKPAAEGSIDRIGKPNEPLLAGKAGGIAWIDVRQGLAETVQRGPWRGRAHGNLSGLFTICSNIPQALH
jgi:hypothetical protein